MGLKAAGNRMVESSGRGGKRARPETEMAEESQIMATQGKGWPRWSGEQKTWQRGQGTKQAKVFEESGSP